MTPRREWCGYPQRAQRSRPGRLVVALEEGAPPRDALASALSDDDLTVLSWIERCQGRARGGRFDARGHPTPGSHRRPGRSVELVEADRAATAAIVSGGTDITVRRARAPPRARDPGDRLRRA